MAKRCWKSVSLRFCLCGGRSAGTKYTRPRPNFSAAARATARWPWCTGSKVPPKRAIFMRLSSPPLPEGRLLGNALHALCSFLLFAPGNNFPGRRAMLVLVCSGANLGHALAQGILQLRNALAGDCRNLKQLKLALFAMLAQGRYLLRIGHIHLGRHHDHRLLFQP